MFMLNILEEEKDKQDKDMIKSVELHDLYDKRKHYGELVKQMHKPIISRKKQLELKILKANIKHIPKIKSTDDTHSAGKGISNESSSQRCNSPVPSGGRSEYRCYFSENQRIKPIKKWRENEMKPMQRKKLAPLVVDYLLEKRKMNDEKSLYNEDFGNKKKRKPIEWKSLVDKMGHKDKVEFLRVKAQQIEEKAKLKDEKNNVGML